MVSTRSTGPRLRPDLAVRYPAPRERVALYVARAAQRYGLRPATLHKLLHGPRPIGALLQAVIEEAVAEGKADRAAAFFAPLEVAMARCRMPLSKGLVLRAFIADNDENEAALAWVLNDTPATRAQWVRHLHIERSAKLEVLGALA